MSKIFKKNNAVYLILSGILILMVAAFLLNGCSLLFNGSCCNRGTISEEPGESRIIAKARDYIEQKYKMVDFEINVADYGCHIQYDIYQDGKIFKSLVYNNGDFFEIF